MTWILLSFLAAFFYSLSDLLSKFSLKDADEWVVAWGIRAFSLPLLVPLLFFIDIPELGWDFWWPLLISGTLNIAVTILYLRAIRLSPLSLTVPMASFTPLFLLVTSPLILGEVPDLTGASGILLIVAGTYILNLRKGQVGAFAPFRAIFHEPGPPLLLLVAFIWSITSNVDKLGILASSPLFYTVCVTIYMGVGLTPVLLVHHWRLARKGEKQAVKQQLKARWKAFAGIALLMALVLFCQTAAIEQALVPYVISIKRTSILGSIIWGWLFFGEKNLKRRLIGAAVMLAGVVLITIFS